MPYAITPRRLAANRENAAKSTGPRTEAGKLRSSQNSLHHHAFAAHLLHPGEDEHNFHLLRNALLADLSPQSTLELCLADRVVSAAWRLKRPAVLWRKNSFGRHGEGGCRFAERS